MAIRNRNMAASRLQELRQFSWSRIGGPMHGAKPRSSMPRSNTYLVLETDKDGLDWKIRLCQAMG